jgi:diguanylate cyclase (GGDEF)-like protein
MRTARIHFAESKRRSALRSYRILDTAADPAFDKLTALAADVCGTPIAAVALVDAEGQWFKSTVGIGALSRIPRDRSFTSDVVEAGAALVITDARALPRYADNPQVTGEPGIRAFAGVPLIDRAGVPFGALCVVDRRPRAFDPLALEMLAVLADRVVVLLEAPRSEPGSGEDAEVSRTHKRDRHARQRDTGRAAGKRLRTIASVCLGAALIGLSGVATWSGFATSSAASSSQRSFRLYDAYTTARYWVGAEEAAESKYQLAPDANTSDAFRQAHTAIETALAAVVANGPAGERAIATGILRRNEGYAQAVDLLFQAVDRHEAGRAAQLESGRVEPAFVDLENRVYAQAQASRQRDVAAGGRLLKIEAIARWATVLAIGIGLLLLAVFIWLRRLSTREQNRQAERHAHEAMHDALTGAPNRALFTRILDRALITSKQAGSSVGVVLVNLDRFKEVNSTLGHDAGDLLLKQVAARISSALAPGEVLARFGADEFAVMITTTGTANSGKCDLHAAVARVQRALAQEFIVDEVALAVEATAGVVCSPEDGRTSRLLLQRVDIALNLAKTNHEATGAYDHTLDHHDPRKLRLLADLRQAASREELVLHYQPMVDIASSRIGGVEALVRWQHPAEGLLAPAEFLPLAESTGFIHELTQWVLRRAVQDAKKWADAGDPLVVSVNLSARCLIDADLPEKLAGILREIGLPAQLLKLEITESAIIADPIRAQDVINRLHEIGVALSIDDFGTGYTSFAYLRDLPVQEIKIDSTFVTHMLYRYKDEVIVRTAVELAGRLGLDSVAEGVDDPAILVALAEMGCTTGQGYYLCRPIPAPELRPWIASWKHSHSASPPGIAIPV